MTRLDKPQIIVHATLAVQNTPGQQRWLPGCPRFAGLATTARNTGVISLHELRSGKVETLHETHVTSAPSCASFAASPISEHLFAVGDDSGSLSIWDLKGDTKKPTHVVPNVHTRRMTALDACGGGKSGAGLYGPPEIATASEDGSVRVFDMRQLAQAVSIIDPAPGETPRGCWAVALGNSHSTSERHLAAGYDNGDLKVFDLKDLALHYSTNLGNGVCSVQYDRWDIQANKLVAGTLEANLFYFDLRTKHPHSGYARLRERVSDDNVTTWCVRHLPQNREVCAVSHGSGQLGIYEYHYPVRRTKKSTTDQLPEGVMGSVDLLNSATVADQPITSIDWSPDKCGLCVFPALDQNVRIAVITRLGSV